jgi:hypothetical protein
MNALEAAWQTITSEFEYAQARAADMARLRATDELNQITRRLKQYNKESDWYDAVLDGAARFTGEAALFSLEGDELQLKGGRNMELPVGFLLKLRQAAAFRNAHETKETTLALRTNNEVSELLAATAPGARAYVIPILNGTRVVAMLFAAADDRSSSNALELIATIASTVLERNSQTPPHIQIMSAGSGHPAQDDDAPDEIESPGERPQPDMDRRAPDWTALTPEEKLIHVRAQRFARVKVAEMQLYRPEACQAGREQKNLYVFLSQEIGNARDLFRTQFMSTRSMVDYLHRELIDKLADDDEALLGAEYPGQMD